MEIDDRLRDSARAVREQIERDAEVPDRRAACREELQTRLVLPLLLPIGVALALLVLVLSISKVFLAGGRSSWVTATIVTLMILGGATALSMARRMRSSSMMVLVGIVVVMVLLSGLVVLGATGQEKATGYVVPTGPAVQTLTVEALPTYKFNATEFDLPTSGITDVKYVDGGGSHTLVFAGIDGFMLAVPDGPKEGKIDLAAGTYTIYCTVPGHRAQGMEAKVVVK